MRKRRDNTKDSFIVFKSNNVKIEIEPNQEIFFEIRNEVTSDLAEAIAIMIRMDIDGLWNIQLDQKLLMISPERCLYWLSGGNKEWVTLDHYNRSWSECYMDFEEEFGDTVMNIINNAQKLGDIKKGFIKYLNLPILYDFAISRGFVK